MPTVQIYQKIAHQIRLHDWDEDTSMKIESDEYEYLVEQFQGTAFCSEYKCYHVSGWEWVPSGPIMHAKRIRVSFVAKYTNPLEVILLGRLSKEGFRVPSVYYAFRSGTDSQKAFLFEQMLPGKELFLSDSEENWIAAMDTVAAIHAKYWNDTSMTSPYWNEIPSNLRQIASNHYNEIRAGLHNHTRNNQLWMRVAMLIEKRLENAPKTLVHSDLFPTNILVNRNMAYLLDWATAGEMPYFMDIGRFTGLLKANSEGRFCNYESSVCRRYYQKMKSQLNMSFDDFMRDVYMGQFIEVMRYYDPLCNAFNQTPSKGQIAITNRLNDLSIEIMSREKR